jgi:arylsulfatase A-like enzyme
MRIFSTPWGTDRKMRFRKQSLLPWLIIIAGTTTAVAADATNNNSDDNDGQPPPPPPPNIVLIVIDDLGSNDLGWHGSGIATPTMDSLLLSDAAIYLSNYYVLPYCSPTRAALLTGRYPLHTGCHDIIRSMSTDGLPLDEITLPQMLRTSHPHPYRTHAVGKWHLGHSRWTQTPTFRGFESFFGYYLGWSDYYTHYTGCDDGVGYDLHWDDREFCGLNCSQYPDERGHYSTHVFTDRAVQVIQNHHHHQQQQQAGTAATNASTTTQPLFLYLAYQGVHAPNEVPLIYSDRYRHHHDDWTDERQLYAGMLTAVDEGIGNVTNALRKAGMWDDTVLIITTDNGGPTNVCSVQGSSNRGRGGKCTVWEGGTVGDALVHFGRRTTTTQQRRTGDSQRKRRRRSTTTVATAAPAATTAVHNNRINHNNIINTTISYPHLFHVVDWFPTLARLAQVVVPNNDSGKPLDGVDQLDGLLGLMYDDSSSTVTTMTSPSRPIRQEVFVGYAALDGNWYGPAVRYGKYKLLQGLAGGGPENRHYIPPGPNQPAPPGGDGNTTTYYRLYDVHVDPHETVDLALTSPVLVDILQAKLREYQKTYVPPIVPDLECGRFAGLVEHIHYGRVWTPWCEKLVVYE